jgi:TatD DNase family protein
MCPPPRAARARLRDVGEVGLDAGPRFYASLGAQKQIFEMILRDCADRGGKILTIHSVRAARAVLDMLEAYLPRSRGSAVFHWFTGTKAEAERGVRLGAYFSINREMLRNDRHRSTVSALPLDRLLTETDDRLRRSTAARPVLPMYPARSKSLRGCARCLPQNSRKSSPPISSASSLNNPGHRRVLCRERRG